MMSKLEHLRQSDIAINFLAKHLKEGTLMLFLGAGISKQFGLPKWDELVNDLRAEVGLAPLMSNPPADVLQRGADDVLDKLKSEEELINLVEKYLYSKMSKLEPSTIFNNSLLIAIAGLLMGSKRGHVRRVITLNYDNLLEWVLSVFGFSVKTIYSLPELEGSEDVIIYHPHGFIPVPGLHKDKSNFIILGMDSANHRLGTLGHPWTELTRHLLKTSVCLFVGMSPESVSDRAISGLFATTGKEVSDNRPLGIWLVLDELGESKIAEFQRNNIYPIKMETPLEVSEFILNICKSAGEKLLA